jgi:hypothetical protein
MKKPVSQLVGSICSMALLLALAGCGADFFPAFKRLATTPDPFSFTSETSVPISTPKTSNAITVTGLTAESSPISITGGDSKYSINGGTATSAAGTVKNTDKVTVTQTSSSSPGTSTTSTLTIGNVTGTYTITTQLVVAPVFTAQTVAAGTFASSNPVVLIAFDGVAGTHVISIADDKNTLNSLYSLDNGVTFTHATQTVPTLNGRTIIVRNQASVISGDKVTTTLTIDGVVSTFVITTQ